MNNENNEPTTPAPEGADRPINHIQPVNVQPSFTPSGQTFGSVETPAVESAPVVEAPIQPVADAPSVVPAPAPVSNTAPDVAPAAASPFAASDQLPQTPIENSPIVSGEKKKFKLPGFLGKLPLPLFIVIIAVIILGGGTVAAYNLYYQNPDKVVADALGVAFTAKTASATGTSEITSDGTTMKVTFDGKGDGTSGLVDVAADVTTDGKTISFKGSGLFDKDGNLYFKVQDVQKLVDNFFAASGVTFDTSAFSSVIAKLENKWIKISADDLKSYSEDYSKTQICVTDALKTFNTDATVKKEVETVYKNNQFLVIDKKLGSKTVNGQASLGYAITVDNTKADSFTKALKDTKIGKQIDACDTTATTSAETTATDDVTKTKTTAELWVTRFGHTPTQLSVTATDDKDSFKATVNPIFNKAVTVDVPTDTTTLKQIGDDFTAAYTDYITSLYGSYDTTY